MEFTDVIIRDFGALSGESTDCRRYENPNIQVAEPFLPALRAHRCPAECGRTGSCESQLEARTATGKRLSSAVRDSWKSLPSGVRVTATLLGL